MKNNCIFCQIIDGTLNATFILKEENCIVIKDIAPKAPIHYLIIPKVHIPDVASISPSQFDVITNLFAVAQKIGKTLPGSQAYKLVINNGHDAGQRVFHLHMHFLSGPISIQGI
jgi:histidine triad (HIT) family protein